MASNWRSGSRAAMSGFLRCPRTLLRAPHGRRILLRGARNSLAAWRTRPGATIRGAILVTEERRNGDDYYSPAQAAHVLRVTPTRVRQLLQAGELEGERDGAGHWSIPARAVVDRLDRLRRERFLEAAGYDPVSIREVQERAEALQRELGRLEGRLESEEKACTSLEADRALLAKRLVRERLRREEVERERDKLLWRLKTFTVPSRVPETAAKDLEREDTGSVSGGARGVSERRSWWRRVFGATN